MRSGTVKCIIGTLLVFILTLGEEIQAQSNIPLSPFLSYVSRDTADNSVHIFWEASTSPNIVSYVIKTAELADNKIIATPFDTVPATSSSYTYIPENLESINYLVTAVDAYGNESENGKIYHSAVKIDIAYDSCISSMLISWDPYHGWYNNINGYRIYSKHENEPYELLDQVGSYVSNFYVENIEENSNYSFYVEAFSNSGLRSLSNKREYFTYMHAAPAFLTLDYVSVIDDQSVEISFTPDLSGMIDDFQLSSATSQNGEFRSIRGMPDLDQIGNVISEELATKGTIRYYRIDALNGCGKIVSSSNTGNNILLRGSAEGSTIKLEWNAYMNFEKGLKGYSVRRMNDSEEFIDIANGYISPDKNVFYEDLSKNPELNLKGELRYQIMALEADGGTGISYSNELAVHVETHIMCPNAFTPNNDGTNDTFFPVMDYTPESYLMMIFDRSGKTLFQTRDPYEGWDGRQNGSAMAPEGVYIYHIEYASYNGIKQVRNGNLTLINP